MEKEELKSQYDKLSRLKNIWIQKFFPTQTYPINKEPLLRVMVD